MRNSVIPYSAWNIYIQYRSCNFDTYYITLILRKIRYLASDMYFVIYICFVILVNTRG